jgi:hypothetical protein
MKTVYNHFNLGCGVYEPQNFTTRTSLIGGFLCPSDGGPTRAANRVAMTGYAGVHHDVEAPIAADNHGVLFLNSAIRYEDVTDGVAMTLFVGEKSNDGLDLGWASGTRASLRNTGLTATPGLLGSTILTPMALSGIGSSPGGPGTPSFVGAFTSGHPGIINFALGDGSVRAVAKSINPLFLQHLAHRADGELMDESVFSH